MLKYRKLYLQLFYYITFSYDFLLFFISILLKRKYPAFVFMNNKLSKKSIFEIKCKSEHFWDEHAIYIVQKIQYSDPAAPRVTTL